VIVIAPPGLGHVGPEGTPNDGHQGGKTMTPRTTTRITGDVDEWLRANVAPGVKYKLLRHDGDVYFDPIYQDMPESLPESEEIRWGARLGDSIKAVWGSPGLSGRALCRRVGETDLELRERARREYWNGTQWVATDPPECAESEGQICPDCRGSKTYVGLRERRDCPTCGGSGLVKEDDDDNQPTRDRG